MRVYTLKSNKISFVFSRNCSDYKYAISIQIFFGLTILFGGEAWSSSKPKIFKIELTTQKLVYNFCSTEENEKTILW